MALKEDTNADVEQTTPHWRINVYHCLPLVFALGAFRSYFTHPRHSRLVFAEQ